MRHSILVDVIRSAFSTLPTCRFWRLGFGVLSTWMLLSNAHAQFTVTNDTVSVTILGYTGTNTDLTIPAEIDGLPVGDIGTSAFSQLPLVNLVLPDSVTNIESGAFAGCASLTNVTFGAGLQTIGGGAFQGGGLVGLTIPTNVLQIGSFAFQSCLGLSNVVLNAGVQKISEGLFSGCTNLSRIQLPGGLVTIDDLAFSGCLQLSGITLPSGVTNIGNSAFASCGSLTNLVLSGGITTIGEYSFFFCTGLTNVTFPSGLVTIGFRAFYGCSGLVSISIPDSVTSIGSQAFLSLSLTAFTVDTNNPAYSSLNGVLYDKAQTTLLNYPPGSIRTSFVLPTGVTAIGNAAFQYSAHLMSVTIPTSVRSVGNVVFINCPILSTVYFCGNAPSFGFGPFGFGAFPGTVYYFPEAIGWDQPVDGVRPVLWNSVIQITDPSFGVINNQFNFLITGTTNIPVVVESCTDLGHPVWSSVQTLSLTNGQAAFSDGVPADAILRFYRLNHP